MKDVFLESGFVSMNKAGEELCGDRVEIINNEEFSIVVLSDGLGSGVKANILSTLTSKIIATMMAEGMDIEECVTTIAETLPICSVRQVAYATFSILVVHKNGDCYMAQYDNPKIILLRRGKEYNYPCEEKVIGGKKILETRFTAEIGDMYILMSDGAIHAGIGKLLNWGWLREDVVKYAELKFTQDMAAKTMAVTIGEACRELYLKEPGDDTTVAVLKVRQRQVVNLMIGPPADKKDDQKVLELFFGTPGKRIVCGGTTSHLVSGYLGKPIETNINYEDPSIPPIARIEGVDLVTEGVITIGRVVEIARKYSSSTDFSLLWKDKNDGASQIAHMLFEDATDVNFFVGRAINPSHQNPNLPITFDIKLSLIEELARHLERMEKKVKVNFN